MHLIFLKYIYGSREDYLDLTFLLYGSIGIAVGTNTLTQRQRISQFRKKASWTSYQCKELMNLLHIGWIDLMVGKKMMKK